MSDERMENVSGITLLAERTSLKLKICNIKSSMGCLKNKDSEYHQHHQHVLDTYLEMINTLDEAIDESENIGVFVI